jgi:hypothetical protein
VSIPRRLQPYLMELKFQGSAAASAFRSLESKLADRRALGAEFRRASREEYVPPLEQEQQAFAQRYIAPLGNTTGPILGEVQSFLAATGVIASILWPSQRPFHGEPAAAVAARVHRGGELRQLLDVRDDSILRARTGGREDARGGFLHFDEMIDEFTQERRDGTFVSFDIGSEAEGTAMRRPNAIRWLDEDTLHLWVNGREANLREIKNELERVLGRITSNATVRFVRDSSGRHRPSSFGMSFGTDLR